MHKSGHILRGGEKSEAVIFRQYEFLKVLPEQTRILKHLHAILLWQVRTLDSGFLFHSDHTGIGSDFQDQNWNQNWFFLFFKRIRPITHNLVFLILFMCVNKIGTNWAPCCSALPVTNNFFYFFYVFIWFSNNSSLFMSMCNLIK